MNIERNNKVRSTIALSGQDALDFLKQRFTPTLSDKPVVLDKPITKSKWAKIENGGIVYPAIIRPFGDKLALEFPDLPMPPVLGNYLSDVIANARMELREHLLDCRENDKTLPNPSFGGGIIDKLGDYEAFCWIHASTKEED